MYLPWVEFLVYNYNTEKIEFCYINVKKAGLVPLFSEICVFVFAVSLNVSVAVFFCLRITLVVELFASAKSELHLDVGSAEIERKGND